MKKSIPLQSPPDYSSLMPVDVASQQAGQGPPPPTTSGMDVDNLSPEEAGAIPDEGKATIHYKVHHRRSETHIHPKTGEKKESHSVRMHVHNFEPHQEEEKPAPKKKKLTESTDAQSAVRDGLTSPGQL